MASKQEMRGLELKRISEDIHRMNSILKPLASLDENTCDDLHTELPNLSTAENRSLAYSNKRHADDSLVKATIMWNPVGDNVKEEPNECRFFGTAGVTQQSPKPFPTTNLYKMAAYGEKENLESGSGRRARGSLDFSNTGLSGSIDGKRLQEGFDILSKPVTRLEIKVVDELNERVGGPGLSISDGKPLNECKAIGRKVSAGPSTAILEKTEGVYSQKRRSDLRLEDSLCSTPDSTRQTSMVESWEITQPLNALVQEKIKERSCDLFSESTQSMKAPLLSQFQDRSDKISFGFIQRPEVTNPCLLRQLESPSKQNFEENVCDVWRHCPMTAKTPLYGQFKAQNMGEHSCNFMKSEFLKTPVLSQSECLSIQDAQTGEEISIQNNDHFVVLFSVQKTLKGSAGRIIKQELLKLSSLCTQYSHKILSWITSLATKQNIRGCLRRLRQIFSSPPRGFVNLNSQKMPEFSTNVSSLSSNRKLAKDKELKAVLMKINEVLVSMERTSSDSVHESKPNFRSPEGVKAAHSCSQHECTAFATIGS